MSVLSCAQFLQSVDFTLNRGAFPVETQPFHGPYTFVNESRGRGWFGRDVRHQLSIYCT